MEEEPIDLNSQNKSEEVSEEVNEVMEPLIKENESEEKGNEIISPSDESESLEPVSGLSEEVDKQTASVETKKIPGWLRNFLFGLLAFLVVFAAGFIVSQITLTKPAQNEITKISLERNQLQDNLTNVQKELEVSKNDLETIRTALSTNQTDLKSALSEIENLKSSALFNQNLSELKYYVALARTALLNADKLSARQALSLAQENFVILSPLLDEDNRAAVDQRLSDSYKLAISNFELSLEELRTLSENLDRIPFH